MVRRFCDICEVEILGLKDGLYEERYTLVFEDPGNLSRLGGQLGKMQPALEMRLQNCHNVDICRQCLEKILIQEFRRRAEKDESSAPSSGV